MFELSSVIFYVLSAIIVFAAAAVVLVPNPIYAALSLAGTMIALGFLYINLQAYFIASVQLIVYAGAVMVLFVMVLMLFDIKKEAAAISGGRVATFLKIACGIVFTGLISWAIRQSVPNEVATAQLETSAEQMAGVKALAVTLFTRYLFAFEALGVLLLLIAVGVVAVSRTRGGTHARD
jgi:NADH-quinone oxidoreductase subunit J